MYVNGTLVNYKGYFGAGDGTAHPLTNMLDKNTTSEDIERFKALESHLLHLMEAISRFIPIYLYACVTNRFLINESTGKICRYHHGIRVLSFSLEF